jgi:hypothetical protein
MSKGTRGAASGAPLGASGPYPAHPLADLLPPMTSDERQKLKDDIKTQGQLDPITLHQGKVLDGRHRQDICVELAVTPSYVTYRGSSPAAFVASKNLARRHLTTSQRAAVGAELLPYFEKEANARRRAGNARGGAGKSSADRHSTCEAKRKAADDAAKAVGVSGRSVSRARRVKEADPEAFEQVKAGKRSVDAAESQVRADKARPEPPEPKRIGARKPPKQAAKRLRQIHADKRERGLTALIALRVKVMNAAGAVEGIEIPEVDLSAVEESEEVDDEIALIYDDLYILARWAEEGLAAMIPYMGDLKLQRRIQGAKAILADPAAGEGERAAARFAIERVEARRRAKRLGQGD